MQSAQHDSHGLVRRSKLYVSVNRENFISKAWTGGADCIILDLEDSIAPSDKVSARKMVNEVIPIVNKGGAEIGVRINREFEGRGPRFRRYTRLNGRVGSEVRVS